MAACRLTRQSNGEVRALRRCCIRRTSWHA